MFLMRLNAIEIDSKSVDATHPSDRFRASDHIHYVVRARGQHGIHYVILKPERIAEIKLQTLAEESRRAACVIHLT